MASGTAYDILASAAASVGVSISWNYLCYNGLDNSSKSAFPGDAAAGLMSYWVITPQTAPKFRLE